MFYVLCVFLLLAALSPVAEAGKLLTLKSPSMNTLYYEEPTNTAKGIVLALHGCNHGAQDFWNQSESCPYCYGLPVGLTTTSYITKRGFIFASFTSTSMSGCWSSSSDEIHMDEMMKLIHDKFGDLKLFLYGISAGGSFTGAMMQHWGNDGLLGSKMKVAASCLHVSALQHLPKDRSVLPPILLVPMTKDHPSVLKAKHVVKSLQAARVHAAAIYLDEILLTPSFFHDHGSGLFTLGDSQKMYDGLLSAKMITAGGSILSDPRDDTAWENTIANLFPSMDFTPNRSPIKELMNMAFAYHEISDVHLSKMVDFFESVMVGK